MNYKKGFKYQLVGDEYYKTGITGYVIDLKWLTLELDGTLLVKDGYAWDGPSGPTIDTASFMRGSLIHDALYELIRKGHIQPSCKGIADQILRDICLEDGMWSTRAWWVYKGVTYFGKSSTLEKNIKEVIHV